MRGGNVHQRDKGLHCSQRPRSTQKANTISDFQVGLGWQLSSCGGPLASPPTKSITDPRPCCPAPASDACAPHSCLGGGSGIPVPSAPPVTSTTSERGSVSVDSSNTLTHTNDMDWDPAPNPKQTQTVGPMSSSQTSSFAPAAPFSSGGGGGGGGGATGAGVRPGGGLSRRGSGSVFLDKVGITRVPDRAWTIALDYLDLAEVSGFWFAAGRRVEGFGAFV